MTFDDHVRAALDELPPDLAAALENVAIVVEDENPDDPDLLGLYHGVPLPERGDMAGALPDKISIYRLPARGIVPRSRRAPRRNPHHGSPRARSLFRPGRGPDRRSRIRVSFRNTHSVEPRFQDT